MNELYTAFIIGLIGSMHCIGMCGPIALALPLGQKSWANRTLGALLYNIGRSLTYGSMGAVFGLLGKGIKLAGFQQWASIFIGVLMIASVVFPYLFGERIDIGKITSGYAGKLVMRFKSLFGRQSKTNLFVIGLLNGLLPCGLVYVAIAGAINTNEVLNAILFMIVFGLGTIPAMLSISLIGKLIKAGLRNKLNRVVPAFIVVLGIIFILRGMSLGIPFISPKSKMLTPQPEMRSLSDNTDDSCFGQTVAIQDYQLLSKN